VFAWDIRGDFVDVENLFFGELFFSAEVVAAGEFDTDFEFGVFVGFEKRAQGIAHLATLARGSGRIEPAADVGVVFSRAGHRW
jgi:hypothetical protein